MSANSSPPTNWRSRTLTYDEENLLKDIASLHRSTAYSDAQIVCQNGKTIPVHKCILAKKSPFFDNALNGRLGFIEGKTATVSLPNDSSVAVEAMIKFIYTCDYNAVDISGAESSSAVQGPLSYHLEIFFMAEKYIIPTLKGLARKKLGECTDISPRDLVAALKKMQQNSSLSHGELNEQICEKAFRQALFLRQGPTEGPKEETKRALYNFPEFLFQLFQKAAKEASAKGR